MSVPPPPVGSGDLGSLTSMGSVGSDDLMMLPGGDSPAADRGVDAPEVGGQPRWQSLPEGGGDGGDGGAMMMDVGKRSSDTAGFRSREYDSVGSLGGLGVFANGGSLNSGGMQELLGFDYQAASGAAGGGGGGGGGGGDGGVAAPDFFQPPPVGSSVAAARGPGSGSGQHSSLRDVGSMSAINSADMSALFSGEGAPMPTAGSRRHQGVLDARPPGGSSDEDEQEDGLDLGQDVTDQLSAFELNSPRLGGGAAGAGAGAGAGAEGDGDKPHRCTVAGCGYAAKGSGHLKRHMRTHTGEKPFKCTWEGCTYASSQSTHLTAHMRKHTGERPFGCPVAGCDYSAARSWHVTRHMQRQHPDAVAAGVKATAAAPSGAAAAGGARAAGAAAAAGAKQGLTSMMKRKQVKREAQSSSAADAAAAAATASAAQPFSAAEDLASLGDVHLDTPPPRYAEAQFSAAMAQAGAIPAGGVPMDPAAVGDWGVDPPPPSYDEAVNGGGM